MQSRTVYHDPLTRRRTRFAVCLLSGLALIPVQTWVTTGAESPAAPGQGMQREVRITSTTDEGRRQSVKREIQTTWTDGDNSFKLKARNVEISEDGKEITPLGDARDAYLFASENRAGVVRQVEFVRGAGGQMTPTYRLRGKPHEFDDDARAWLSAVLVRFVKNTNTAARARHTLKRQGAGAALGEVSEIESEHGRREYLESLVEAQSLSPSDLKRLTEQIGQQLTSQHYRTQLLLHIAQRHSLSEEVRPAFFQQVENIGSPHARKQILTQVVGREQRDPEVLRAALQSAASLLSGYDLTSFLVEFAQLHPVDGTLRDAFNASLEKIGSPSDRERVRAALGEGGDRR